MHDGDASPEGEDATEGQGAAEGGLDQNAALRELRLVIARQPSSVRVAVEKHLNLPQFSDPSGAHGPASPSQDDIVS